MDTCLNTIDGKPCGTSLSPSDKFCPECGKGVDKPPNDRPKCPNLIEGRRCDWNVDQTYKFCPSCGFKLPRSLFEDKTPPVCLNILADGRTCNTELPPDTKFCPECGKQAEVGSEANYTPLEEKKTDPRQGGADAVVVGQVLGNVDVTACTNVNGCSDNYTSKDDTGASMNELGDTYVTAHIPGDNDVASHVPAGKDVAAHVSDGKDVAAHVSDGKDVAAHVSDGNDVAAHVSDGKDVVAHVPAGKDVAAHVPDGKDVAAHSSVDRNVVTYISDDRNNAAYVLSDSDVATHVPGGKDNATQASDDRKESNDSGTGNKDVVQSGRSIDSSDTNSGKEFNSEQYMETIKNNHQPYERAVPDARGAGVKTEDQSTGSNPQPDSGGQQAEAGSNHQPDSDGQQAQPGSNRQPDSGGQQAQAGSNPQPDSGGQQAGADSNHQSDYDGQQAGADSNRQPDSDGQQAQVDSNRQPDSDGQQAEAGSNRQPDSGGQQAQAGSNHQPDSDGQQAQAGSNHQPDSDGQQAQAGSNHQPDSDGQQAQAGSNHQPDSDGQQAQAGSTRQPDSGGQQAQADSNRQPDSDDQQVQADKSLYHTGHNYAVSGIQHPSKQTDQQGDVAVKEEAEADDKNGGDGINRNRPMSSGSEQVHVELLQTTLKEGAVRQCPADHNAEVKKDEEGKNDDLSEDLEAMSTKNSESESEKEDDEEQDDGKGDSVKAVKGNKRRRPRVRKAKRDKGREKRSICSPSKTSNFQDRTHRGCSKEPVKKDSEVNTDQGNQQNLAQTTPNRNILNIQARNEDTVEVHFHVLFSPLMKFSSVDDTAKICFGQDRLGGMDPKKSGIVLTEEKCLDEGFLQMHGTVQIPRQLTRSTLDYKYVVLSHDGEVRWEDYKRGERKTRSFSIPQNYKNSDVWHQYDAVVYPGKENEDSTWYMKVGDKIRSLFTGKNKNDELHKLGIQKSLDAFSVRIDEKVVQGTRGLDIIKDIERVYGCLSNLCLDQKHIYKDEKRFGAHLSDWLEEQWAQFEPEKASVDERVVMAIITLWMCGRYKVDMGLISLRKVLISVMMNPSQDSRKCDEWDAFEKHFSGSDKTFHTLVFNEALNICKWCASNPDRDLTWLNIVPWIHFWSHNAGPWSLQIKGKHNDHIPVWWGNDKFKEESEECKRKLRGKEDLDGHLWETITRLAPLFRMDKLLPRTIVALLSPRHFIKLAITKLFPPDVLVAFLYFHILVALKNYESTKLPVLKECVDVLCQGLSEASYREEHMDIERYDDLESLAYSASEISFELFHCVISSYTWLPEKSDMVASLCHLGMLCLDKFAELHESMPEDRGLERGEGYRKFIDSRFADFQKQLYSYLNGMNQPKTAESLRVRNTVMMVKFRCQWMEKRWHEMLITSVKEILNRGHIYDNHVILDYYCDTTTDLNSFHPVLSQCLNECAFMQLENLCQKANSSSIYWKERDLARFGSLLSEVMKKAWPKQTQEESAILSHILTWGAFPFYLQFYGTYATEHVLSEDCVANILHATEVLITVGRSIVEGVIEVGQLKLVKSKVDRMREVLHILSRKEKWDKKSCNESDCAMKAECVEKAMEYRLAEIQAFEDKRKKASQFVELCERIPNVSAHTLKMKCQKEVHNCRFTEICDPTRVHTAESTNYQPVITVFRETPGLETVLEKMFLQESEVFLQLWDNHGKWTKNSAKVLSLDETITKVFYPAEDTWLNLREKFQNGTLNFRELEQHFSAEKFDKDRLQGEFVHFNGGRVDEKVKERVKQVLRYRNLKLHVKSAKTILEIKDALHLTGNFEEMEIIVSSEVRDNPRSCLKSMDESIEKVTERLKDLDSDREKSLFEFSKCTALVEWLGKEIHNRKELKVFVDLASISAGEGDMEIKKVSMLHSATTGYSPLLFDLPEYISCKEFLKRCDQVWKALKADPDLPKKLVDLNRHLKWLEMVKTSHGSVEASSLSQAEAINNKGIYWIGSIPKQKKQQNVHSLDSTIRLTIPQTKTTETETERQEYSYSQLHDLQSRLMLVAGQAEKGKEEVGRFTEVLDSVTRLANAYIKLCQVGSVLFYNLRIVMNNSTQKIVVDFGQDKLRLNTSSKDVNEEAIDLARFLEDCLEAWLQYYGNQRSKYFPLNHYTIEQLVILQGELVKVNSHNHVANTTFPLLECVKPHCTERDLLVAMDNALKKVNVLEEETSRPADYLESEKAEFVAAIEKAGYSRKDALRALAAGENPADPEAGLMWCLENAGCDSDSDEESGDGTAPKGQRSFEGWSVNKSSLETVTKEALTDVKKKERTLCEKLTGVWESFLAAVSGSLSNYMSVEHLGIVLRELAQLAPEEASCKTLPVGFKTGEPNLIVCPQADILGVTLSIYTSGVKETCPLPTPSEVLLCTVTTTLDQVDIFWRRAVFDPSGKTYCLVNADKLDYDVSDKAERRLEVYMEDPSKNEDYRMVVLCSSEREQRSRIVTALEKYKRPLFTTQESLSKCIEAKLTNEDPCVASCVDISHCTVRVIKSARAGVGKTLYKNRLVEKLEQNFPRTKKGEVVRSIPLHGKSVDVSRVVDKLLGDTPAPGQGIPRIIHFDVAYEVQEGVDFLLFNLLILGAIRNSKGFIWRKTDLDLYLVETMPLMVRESDQQTLRCAHSTLDFLPSVMCRSPEESLEILMENATGYTGSDLLFDEQEFKSAIFQRPFQYLRRLNHADFQSVNPSMTEGNLIECLEGLLRHCGIPDPSWTELRHFVWFLNVQLKDCESSVFCGAAAAGDLPGFLKFVIRFMIKMSRDFATRSLNISEETPTLCEAVDQVQDEEELLERYQMRRTWESSPHPYIFFNPDHNSMTFLGFNIVGQAGDMVDPMTREILEEAIMPRQLQQALVRNKVPLTENFDNLPREQKLIKLCRVMGIEDIHDPDHTYELTTDNVKKMLAIYMRFRCGIPVIVMGETGCGKTRLVKFLCSLQKPPELDTVPNMVLMKVHGGTTEADIISKVKQAEQRAKENCENYGSNMFTVLFFDEANTTEAIGLIKEIMCDGCMDGEPLHLTSNLKIVAACNPYRKHSDEMIRRLEQAGLGYHVEAEKTVDRLGSVPMRRLVYRVQALPQSLLPLVWDFGQLNTTVEMMYIRQMVLNCFKKDLFEEEEDFIHSHQFAELVTKILAESQKFMRQLQNECSFVSLRDVERTMKVMCWFYEQGQQTELFEKIQDKVREDMSEEDSSETEEEEESLPLAEDSDLKDVVRSLVLAIGTCYHACLSNRSRVNYREHIATFFKELASREFDDKALLKEITGCQDAFLDEMKVGENIARNQALKENVFMMVVAIELRLPLFLVGKPGSSKSLAKTIVEDAMQGSAAHGELFKAFKQVQMVSFQCSPLSTADGIVGTFRQCSQFQKDKNLDQFVSAVVLDEIGLAEDSSRMPLKTLHPLLEDGCQGDEKPEPYKKVAFIGISNWALDPAKMNRGVFVQREVPDEDELKESAEGICSTDRRVSSKIKPFVSAMSAAYLHLFERATQERREFFGLRDFYSLLKMLYGFVKRSNLELTWFQLQHAIKRNFGGLAGIDPVESFRKELAGLIDVDDEPGSDDPDCSAAGLIKACLLDVTSESESRYLLLLTENYGALTILQQQILSQTSGSRSPITIFGSSFPKDQEYTQICRNINRIKICMETGNTVILLNLENLYESLYDALNQYYVYLGGERFVDLGLGTHRVKCRVHKDFRLVVVAEKEVVYDKFPIPLINRMEKHFLTVGTILNEVQLKLASELQRWAENFASSRNIHTQRSSVKKAVPGDAFVGYHADTAPSVILHEWTKMHAEKENGEEISQEQVLQSAKRTLLWCATPDAVCRLKTSRLLFEAEDATKIYFHEQKHESLQEYLTWKIFSEREVSGLIQVTSHSKLLSARDMSNLSQALQIPRDEISLLSLQSFDTEQQFCRQLRKFLTGSDQQRLLIIQCDSGDKNASLVASARYCTLDEIAQHTADIRGEFCILLIVQLPRIAGGCFSGFQVGQWQSVHIDELCAVEENIPDTVKLFGHSIGELLQTPDHPGHVTASQSVASQHRDTVAMNSQHPEPMEVDVLERGGNQMDWESETTEGLVPPPAHNPVLDTSMFVHKCLQAAAAMIKDDDDNHSRTTARVHLLFDLLVDPAAGELRFADVINKRLVELLNIREHRLTSLNIARSWLCDEAAQPHVISRAGTLKRSWMQVIENKITPLLAGIIAFMDTNNNLDLLIPGTASGEVSDEVSSECEMWKRRLWLMLMNDPDATPLDHKELLSPKRKIELREIYSKLFGFGVTITAPKLPFSWILISKVRSLLKSSPEIRDTDTIAQLVADSGLGRALNSVTEIEHKAELLKYYLQDFISIIHPTSSPCENQLICQSVHTVLMSRDDGAGIISSLVRVHQVYEECQGHLQNFSSLNRVWKDCAKTVDDYLKTNPDHFVHRSPEILIDVLATQQLLENLQPTKDEMDTPRGKNAWLRKVLSFKPVIERVCQSEGEGISGEEMKNRLRCEALTEIRNTWSRIEVLKLFIDHVCPPDAKEAKKWKFVRCMALWELIKDTVDFKHLPSLEKVEKFLMLSNRGALQHFFGKLQKCNSCTEEMKAVPMLLPCGHVVCVKCCHGFAMADKECPVCRESIPEDYQPKEATDDRKSLEAFSSYQQRCNSFFMALVSQLCFANDSPPDDLVVQKLLTFVTKRFESKHPRYQLRTKAMSVLDCGIDPNPVVRSFLLQLLLRASSEADVIEHLKRFFAQAKEVCMGTDDSQQDTHDQVEMCLLVTQCFEDSYRNKNCVHQSEDEEQEVLCAAQLLKEAHRQGVDGDVNVDTLRNIAKVRYGLTVTAKSLQKVFVTGDSTMIPQTGSFRKLVEAARLLCEECGTNWPRIFLMREICRSYGSHSFDEVRKRKLTEWLLPAENTNQQGSADHYVVIGDEYRRLRELLTRVSLGEDIQQLTAFLQTAGMQENVVKTRLLLAVHREITMASVPSEGPLSANSAEIKKKIQDVCLTADTADGDLINRLFDNHVGESCRQLVVNPQQSVRDQHIMCLVFHLMCVVQNPNNSRLLQPIVALARNPHNMIGCYLATMPEDQLSEVHQALLDAGNSATNMRNEKPVMYKCPRGHPYVIGDCGRPAVEDVCREPGCGLRIGGVGHKLTQGNTKVGDADTVTQKASHQCGRCEFKSSPCCLSSLAVHGKVYQQPAQGRGVALGSAWFPPTIMLTAVVRDTTRPGHVLGAPQSRSRRPAPERSLNPASCSIVRALTHMAMYIGANHHSEEVTGLIQSGVTTSLEDFLWGHISVDFDVIQAALGKGFDDVLVLLHHLLDRIHNDVSHGGDAHHNLKNKAGRSKWEEQFNLTYVSPVLSRLEDTVAMLNQKLLNDDRLGGNALMRVLFEADTPEGRAELGNLVEVPAFWRYRSHISLEHLEQVFNQQENQGPGACSTEQFALLQLFLQQDHVLRAIQYLPSILKLQRLLIQKYQRRIDASEANTMHHMQVYQEMDDLSRREYKKLLHDVSQAWDIVRESIPSHSYPSPKGRVFVPREYCQQSISSNSSLAMLLPSLRGLGLCSYALVHFLLRKQNEFLQQYYQITGKEMSSIDTVDFCYASSLTLAHLISYDPDRDILPLILANSKYSFEVGKGTQVQYDFISFQHRLDSRFFQGKPLLRVEQVETVIFRTEVSSASVFKTLRDKISQVSLWQGVKAQICKELRTVPDVCSALANVDVSISFLVSAPQQGELHLEDFMVNTLKMTESLYSPKAKAHCLFKHVQALWLLLSLEKMRRLTHHGQDAFEGLEAVFLTELTEEQEDSLQKYLKKLKANKLDLFTEQLHDCLVLRIAVTQDRTAEDFMDVEQTKLRDMLMGHVESSLYEDMAAPGISLPDLYLQDFPEDILCKQTAAVLHQAICQERPSLHH